MNLGPVRLSLLAFGILAATASYPPNFIDNEDGYIQIAESAPRWNPSVIDPHNLQRFLVPYVVGSLGKPFGLNGKTMLVIGVIAFSLLSLFIFQKVLEHLKFTETSRVVLTLVLASNLFLFRHSYFYPGMIQEPAFTFALLASMAAALSGRFYPLLILTLFGITVRQTFLLVTPILALYWIWRAFNTRTFRFKVLIQAALLPACASLCFYGIGLLIRALGVDSPEKAIVTEHMWAQITDVFVWIKGPEFTNNPWFPISRFLSPFFLVATLAATWGFQTRRASPGNRSALFLAFGLFLAVVIQPILGARFIYQGLARLSMLALPPLLIGLGLLMNAGGYFESRLSERRSQILFGLALLLGSLHPFFTWIGPKNETALVATQMASALLLIASLSISKRTAT